MVKPGSICLTTISKERLQQFGAAPGQHSRSNFDPMIQLRVVQDLHDGTHRTSFGIIGAVHQTLEASVHQSPGAHRARLNCNKQLAISDAVITKVSGRLPQCNYFGVRCWIRVGNVAIPSASHNCFAADDDRPDRYFSSFECALRAAQCLLHPEFVCTFCRIFRRGGRYLLFLGHK